MSLRRHVALLSIALLLALSAGACSADRTRPTIALSTTTSEDPLQAALATGEAIYVAQCLTCHGAGDEGELAPSLRDGLTDTFASCKDQATFVTVGAEDWPSDTYGDDDTPLGRYPVIMGASRDVLDPAEVVAVNTWVRVELAGLDPVATAADCGVDGY